MFAARDFPNGKPFIRIGERIKLEQPARNRAVTLGHHLERVQLTVNRQRMKLFRSTAASAADKAE